MSTERLPETMSPDLDPPVTDAAMAADAPVGATTGTTAGTTTGVTDATAAGIPAAAPAPLAVTAAISTPAPTTRARTRVLGFGKRLVRFVVTVALFSAGVVAGWQYFVGSQPVAAPVGDPAVVGNPTPAVVAELANAIAADDSDAIRAALLPEIFSSYTADLQSFGLTKVEGVETLGTYIDGPRTATVLVIHGRDVERNPFSINLVVLTQDGKIVRLR